MHVVCVVCHTLASSLAQWLAVLSVFQTASFLLPTSNISCTYYSGIVAIVLLFVDHMTLTVYVNIVSNTYISSMFRIINLSTLVLC